MSSNENAYERFRRLHTVKNNCLRSKTSLFIENHESSTTIVVDRTEESIPAVIVMTAADGPDNAYLYVYDEADIMRGDYFTWNEEEKFFVLDKERIIKDVDYHKYKVLECNVLVNNSFWAYFKGNMTSFKNTTLKSNGYEQVTSQPLLIAPINSELKLNGYITINDQNWRVVDADRDTINGIGYYYVEKDLNSRNLENDMDELEENGEAPTATTWYKGQTVSVVTEKGYIKADKNIQIIKRTVTSVTFKLLESGVIHVAVQESGEIKEHTYTVKEV